VSRLNRWWVYVVAASVAAAALLLTYGCQPSEDPAAALLKSQGTSIPAPATTDKPAAEAAASKPGAGLAATGGAPGKAPAEGATTAGKAPAKDEKPAEDSAKAGSGSSEKKPASEAPAAKPEAGAEKSKTEAGSEKTAKDEAKGKPETKGKDKGESESGIAGDERITNFANLDPRDIIVKKYDAMAAKHTRPWDPEKDAEDFIPETGRIDPLNPVNSAIPDELKPPRSGETDQNEIETYLIAAACTGAVDQIRSMVQVRNVLKIGAVKYVTIMLGPGQGGTVEVGQSFQFFAGVINFVPIQVTLSVDSASEDEVVITVTAAGQGTQTSVSKSTTFIPVRYSG
jgi:hypothetical protein